MSKPRLTVGMPVYNGENYVESAIRSILEQDFEDFEFIISDNCSTDGTEEICRKYAAQDRRIQYHRSDENRGGSWNYNRLVGMASGEFFRWAAHDDILAPQNLRRCVKILQQLEKDVILCYPRTILIDEHGQPAQTCEDYMHTPQPEPHKRFHQVLHNIRKVNPVFGVMRLEALKKTNLQQAFSGSDAVLLCELALLGRFVEIPEYLFYRRFHTSMCSVIPDLEARAIWTDPANRGKRRNSLFALNLYYETIKSVRHSPISRAEKLRCYGITTSHWLRRKWRPIIGDILRLCKVMPLITRLAYRNSGPPPLIDDNFSTGGAGLRKKMPTHDRVS